MPKPFVLTVTPFGFDGVATQLEELTVKGRNMKRPLNQVGKYLVSETHKRFIGERDPSGHPWVALKPSTVQRRGSAHPILRVTGALFNSVMAHVSGSEVKVSANTEYAPVHQLGATLPSGATIPVRAYLGINKTNIRQIGVIMRDFIVK